MIYAFALSGRNDILSPNTRGAAALCPGLCSRWAFSPPSRHSPFPNLHLRNPRKKGEPVVIRDHPFEKINLRNPRNLREEKKESAKSARKGNSGEENKEGKKEK